MKQTELDDLIVKMVAPPIRKEMEVVLRTFNTIVTKFSYLFDGDELATQNMLIASFFTNKQMLYDDGENETFYFDETALLTMISDDKKNEMYKKVMEAFITQIDINKVMTKDGE